MNDLLDFYLNVIKSVYQGDLLRFAVVVSIVGFGINFARSIFKS